MMIFYYRGEENELLGKCNKEGWVVILMKKCEIIQYKASPNRKI